MNRQSLFHAVGRFFPTFFISFLLGGAWGFTAVVLLGVVASLSHLGEIGWHLLAGGALVASLSFVQRIAGWPSAGGVATEKKSRRTDKIISVFSFAVAYVLVWVALRTLAVNAAAHL